MKVKRKEKRNWKNEKSSSESASGSESNKMIDEEHDLSDYAGDCIKLMGEVFKILGDRKLKQILPAVLKPITVDDLKASLVEESMTLSKKRVISILNGNTYSSSSETDAEECLPQLNMVKKDPDVISLDGITDDSDIFCWDDDDLPEVDATYSQTVDVIKVEERPIHSNRKKIKRQKKSRTNTLAEQLQIPKVVEKKKVTKPANKPASSVTEEKAMTALELLELQARARAIKSQLALENIGSPIDKLEESTLKSGVSPKNETTDLKDFVEELPRSDVCAALPKASIPKKVKLRRDHLRIESNRFLNPNAVESNAATVTMSQPQETETSLEPVRIPSDHEEILETRTRRRSRSTDSLILESPSHPLIVISSEEDDESKLRKGYKTENDQKKLHIVANHILKNRSMIIDTTKFTEKEHACVETNLAKSSVSSSEEGEVADSEEDDEPPLPEESGKQISADATDHTLIPTNYSGGPIGSHENICTDSEKHTPQALKIHEAGDPDCIVLDSEPDFDTESDENMYKTQLENAQTEEDHTDATWKSRWLDSTRVKNVLITSKLYNNMKRNISSKREQQLPQPSELTEEPMVHENEGDADEGSVQQFNKLHKSNDKKIDPTPLELNDRQDGSDNNDVTNTEGNIEMLPP